MAGSTAVTPVSRGPRLQLRQPSHAEEPAGKTTALDVVEERPGPPSPVGKEEELNDWQQQQLARLHQELNAPSSRTRSPGEDPAQPGSPPGPDIKDPAHPEKPARVRWTEELHACFVRAVDRLGGHQQAKPEAIRDLMAKGLTIPQVKSHLQKYRWKQQKLATSTGCEARVPPRSEGPPAPAFKRIAKSSFGFIDPSRPDPPGPGPAGPGAGSAAPDDDRAIAENLEDGDATVAISAVPGDGDAADEEIEMELARQRKLACGGPSPPPPRPAAGQASGSKRSRPATQDTPAAKRHELAAAPAEAAGIAERRWDVREAELQSAELASFNVHFEALRQINASLLASNVSLLASNAQKDEQLQAQQVELDARQEKLQAQQEIIAHLLADSPDLVRLLSRAGAQ